MKINLNLSGFDGMTAKRLLPLGNHTITISNIETITHNPITKQPYEGGGYIIVTGQTTDGIDWDDRLMGNSKQYFINDLKRQLDPDGPNWEGATLVEALTTIVKDKVELKVAHVKVTKMNTETGLNETYYNKHYRQLEDEVVEDSKDTTEEKQEPKF